MGIVLENLFPHFCSKLKRNMTKKKLLQVRLNKGFSQEKLADLIGMTQSNYSRRENGRKNISEIEWLKIAKILGVDKENIYEPDGDNSNVFHQFNIPDSILKQLELLRTENIALKEKLKALTN